jgi:hypothetical protein
MIENVIFIGNKNNPNFMIEIYKNKKKFIVYKPDKYSLKIKEFYEQYALGEIVHDIHYKKFYFIKNDCKQYLNKYEYIHLLSEIVFETKDKYIWIKDSIYESKKSDL